MTDDWLNDADLLAVRADRSELLIVLPLRFAIEIAKTAERAREISHSEQKEAPVK
jgi:hypothetical protein